MSACTMIFFIFKRYLWEATTRCCGKRWQHQMIPITFVIIEAKTKES